MPIIGTVVVYWRPLRLDMFVMPLPHMGILASSVS